LFLQLQYFLFAGYSFTGDDAGYARNQTDVGRDLYAALVQFFKLFPELQKNEFYTTGESYAGNNSILMMVEYKLNV
jgi:carboxypeptidase C (cathepsin A)